MDETLIRGDVNELQCILDFQKRGYYCSIPFSGSCRYDVIVDINHKLYKIQCKSSCFHEDDGTLRFCATRQTTNTKKTTSYKYTEDEVDYFYTSWNGYSFLIPIQETSTAKYLRVKKPLSGVQETMSIGSDYLIDNVINSIKENSPIQKYINNRIISIEENGEEKLWNQLDLLKIYNDRQIKYIKGKIMKDGIAYNKKWKYKEFPEL